MCVWTTLPTLIAGAILHCSVGVHYLRFEIFTENRPFPFGSQENNRRKLLFFLQYYILSTEELYISLSSLQKLLLDTPSVILDFWEAKIWFLKMEEVLTEILGIS